MTVKELKAYIKENTTSVNLAIYDNTEIGVNNLVISELRFRKMKKPSFILYNTYYMRLYKCYVLLLEKHSFYYANPSIDH